jgi:hypothetical protein
MEHFWVCGFAAHPKMQSSIISGNNPGKTIISAIPVRLTLLKKPNIPLIME